MKDIRLGRLVVCVMALCLVSSVSPAAEPERVHAAKWFGAGAKKDRKYIETDSTQVLVFDAANGEYILDGADLDIDAAVAEVNGNVIIRAFTSGVTGDAAQGVGNRGPDGPGNRSCGRDGCPGSPGNPGEKGPTGGIGPQSGKVKIKIKKLLGTGTLTIINDGGVGGQGGPGGEGGNGGQGGRGRDRKCPDAFGGGGEDPGHGGQGGDGGVGGPGGDGGLGGNAGPIDYSKEVQALVNTKRVVLQSKGGAGGRPGPGGHGGAGGAGNQGGSGTTCFRGPSDGGGGSGPGGDRRAQQAATGGTLGSGKDGPIACYNCGA